MGLCASPEVNTVGSGEIPRVSAGGWWGLVLLFLFSIIVSATIWPLVSLISWPHLFL